VVNQKFEERTSKTLREKMLADERKDKNRITILN